MPIHQLRPLCAGLVLFVGVGSTTWLHRRISRGYGMPQLKEGEPTRWEWGRRPLPPEIDIQLLAGKFGKDLLVQVFRDDEVLSTLTRLLVRTFTDPRVTRELTSFFKEQFTTHDATVESLKKFLLADVIGDPWVTDALLEIAFELGDSIRSDPEVWPDPTLQALGDAAMEALKTEEFRSRAVDALFAALSNVAARK